MRLLSYHARATTHVYVTHKFAQQDRHSCLSRSVSPRYKQSGKVAYAVLSYGGFLGIGDDHYPTPWASLKYDTRLGGYVIGVTVDQLQGAPKYRNDNEWAWSRAEDERVYGFYKTAPYW